MITDSPVRMIDLMPILKLITTRKILNQKEPVSEVRTASLDFMPVRLIPMPQYYDKQNSVMNVRNL